MKLFRALNYSYLSVAFFSVLIGIITFLVSFSIKTHIEEIIISNIGEVRYSSQLTSSLLMARAELVEVVVECKAGRQTDLALAVSTLDREMSSIQDSINGLVEKTTKGLDLSESEEERQGELRELNTISSIKGKVGAISKDIVSFVNLAKAHKVEELDLFLEDKLEGKFAEIAVLAKALADDALKEMNEELSEIEKDLETSLVISGTIALICFLFSLCLGRLFSGKITSPLLSLQEKSHHIAAGDFSPGELATDHLIDEVNELTQDFHVMAQSLDKSMTSIERLNDEVVRRKRAELNLKETNQSLRKEIVERQKVEAEKEELIIQNFMQSKMASVGEIATGVAHEINQPLSFIQIIFESVLRDIEEKGHIDQIEFSGECEEALQQVSRIVTIIDHLRVFGRADSISFEKVDVKTIFQDTLILMGERLRLANIELEQHYCEEIPMVLGNKVNLEQVFINLLQNSIDALEGEKEARVRFAVQVVDKKVEIQFSDNGIGLAKEEFDKIFDPFYTTKEVGKGTGLGLSIVFSILQEHSATISCSRTDGWTTFTINFPELPR